MSVEGHEVFDPKCGHYHPADVSRHEDGPWESTFVEHCGYIEAEKERHLAGMAEHGAAAMVIALNAGDFEAVDRAVAAVLRRNDPPNGGPEGDVPGTV